MTEEREIYAVPDNLNLELICLAIVDDLIDIAEEQGNSHVSLETETARWVVDVAKKAAAPSPQEER